MNDDLKPCPFCGDEADYFTENFGAVVWVQCMGCGARTSQYNKCEIVDGKDGKAWARTAWGRRTWK